MNDGLMITISMKLYTNLELRGPFYCARVIFQQLFLLPIATQTTHLSYTYPRVPQRRVSLFLFLSHALIHIVDISRRFFASSGRLIHIHQPEKGSKVVLGVVIYID